MVGEALPGRSVGRPAISGNLWVGFDSFLGALYRRQSITQARENVSGRPNRPGPGLYSPCYTPDMRLDPWSVLPKFNLSGVGFGRIIVSLESHVRPCCFMKGSSV